MSISENQQAPPETKAEQSSREILQAPVTAWWAAVLAGQGVKAHPVHAGLRAELIKGVLILRGSVISEEERSAVANEALLVLGPEVSTIENELEIKPESKDLPDVLQQRIIASFKSASEADFARRSLREQSEEPEAYSSLLRSFAKTPNRKLA